LIAEPPKKDIMNADKVLVDTSVWVEYFRGGPAPISEKVDKLVSQGEVCVPKIVLAELIQGAKSEREISVIEDFFEAFTIIDQTHDTWLAAGKLSRRLKNKGKTVHLIDCYTAVIAQENSCALITLDDHFKEIQKVTPIALI
jgi:predicted nucleic acid-binding protein